jgi:uncharacterized membrane protein
MNTARRLRRMLSANRLPAMLVAAAVAARILLVAYAPPLLDVYYYDAQAVAALLAGSNPYGHIYTGIPQWLATPGASNVFAYFPVVPLFLAPFGAYWDVRIGLVAADLVVACCIWSVGGSRARASALVFLLLPFDALFSTSYPNNTLVAMAFLGLAIALEAKGRWWPSGMLLGVSLAASQFAWLMLPFFAVHYARTGRLRTVLVSLAVAAALLLPFFAWSPAAFVNDTVLFQFGRGVRGLVTPEAFGFDFNPTLAGLVMTAIGYTVPSLIRAGATVAAMALLLPKVRDLGSMLFALTAFLTAAMLFLPNDLSWWYLELPLMTALFWTAMRRRGDLNA